MLSYALRRIFGAVPTLFVIITLAFFLIRIAPGGPFDGDRPLPAEIKANIEKVYHLDEPLPVQYGRYLANILQGDFGPSFRYRDYSVNDLIYQGFPYSLAIGFAAILIAFTLGTFTGIMAALKQNTMIDFSIMGLAMTGITIPNFVVAPLLIMLFSLALHWFPVGGVTGKVWFILPIITLALPPTAYIARLTRGSMIEVLRSNYIRTARAKGMPESIVLSRHALKAALLPVVSYLGPAIAGIITGSIVIEQIFSIPGIGRYFVQGALNRDYLLVMGIVVFYGSLIIALNLLVDIAYGFLDPRVRYE